MTLKVSSSNPRYFEDTITGKVVVLGGSHTWNNLKDISNTSPPSTFDYNGHLTWLKQHNHNFIRLWTWELSKYTYSSEYNYAEPFPWQRTGPGNALDGKPKFDLTKFNQSYFDRLRTKVIAANNEGIYVSIMLFEGHGIEASKTPWCWDGHPFHSPNNINGVEADTNGDGRGNEYFYSPSQQILSIQQEYVKKVIDTVNDIDNVLYEIANEPRSPSKTWQYNMISFIKNYEATKGVSHPVGMVSYLDPTTDKNQDMWNSSAEWISPGWTVWGNDPYQVNPPINNGSKVVIVDTDHLWGVGGDRIWVWKCFCRGLNPIFMDDMTVNSTYEGARNAIGSVIKYADKMNMENMIPISNSTTCSTLYSLVANDNTTYLFYQPNSGKFSININPTDYYYEWFDTVTDSVVETGNKIFGTEQVTPPTSNPSILYLTSTECSLNIKFKIEIMN